MNNYFRLIDTAALDELLQKGIFPFSKYLFWDTEIDSIDIKKNDRYIIERVLTRGQLKDFYLLTHIYTRDEITNALFKCREMDAKTVNFCSLYFNIPKNKMHVSPFYS